VNTHEEDLADQRVEKWASEYSANEVLYRALKQEVEFTLNQAIAEAGLKVHSVVGRVKGIEDFLEKIERKGYGEPFEQMVDIVGARVVCLFLDDLDRVDEIVLKSFNVHKREDKSKDGDPQSWAYQSIHYDCTLRETDSGARYDAIKGIWFEIQVRTMLQDAWANVEHYLAYKGLSSVPEELRRDFSALAGVFHVADSSFQRMRDSARDQDAEAVVQIEEARHAGGDGALDIRIDRSTLKAYIRQEFPDREPSDNAEYSVLVEQLAAAGITTISALQDIIAENLSKALAREKHSPPRNDNGKVIGFTDAGIVRITVDYGSSDFRKLRGIRNEPPLY
jgi:putative GTP pyrophosphokinase